MIGSSRLWNGADVTAKVYLAWPKHTFTLHSRTSDATLFLFSFVLSFLFRSFVLFLSFLFLPFLFLFFLFFVGQCVCQEIKKDGVEANGCSSKRLAGSNLRDQLHLPFI